jgi:hypothetical protein
MHVLLKKFSTVILLLFISSQALCDEIVKSPLEIIKKNVEEKIKTFEQVKLERLIRIRGELVSLNSRINNIKKELQNFDLDMVSKIQAESKLNSLRIEYDKKRFLFIETATNIHLNEVVKKQEKPDFFQDLQQILAPALNSFKQISDRPREIQALKEMAAHIEIKYSEAKIAEKRLVGFFNGNDHKELKWKLKESIQITEALVTKLKIQKEDINFKIRKIERDQEPFITTFSKVILNFIKTKGLNLFLALFAFISVFWIFRVGKGKFLAIVNYNINRSTNREMYQWITRPMRVIYNVTAVLSSFMLAILTLYALNDWVLVTFALFVIAALVWSSKEYFPLFLEQSKIVLNLGSIRENERVMYNGIPWQIKNLGYYCRLYNPVLSGGFLRVNTRELMKVCSRRIIDKEPWFPTKTGDWVEFENVFGQVSLQSPEQVIIKTLGGESLIYKASDFYSKWPKNLSNGFAIEFTFGVDYDLQKNIFSEVIPNFNTRFDKVLNGELSKEVKGKSNVDIFTELNIEFLSAAESSLDLRFFVKCSGSVASKKLMLTRAIQAEFVKVCNEYDYTIPYKQLTVHIQKSN